MMLMTILLLMIMKMMIMMMVTVVVFVVVCHKKHKNIVILTEYSMTFRLIKDFVTTNQGDQITRTLKVLGGDFAYSQNPNTRKGGLIGLAAVAIGLGKVKILWLFCEHHKRISVVKWKRISELNGTKLN